MKVFTFNDVENMAQIMRLPDYHIEQIRLSEDPVEYFRSCIKKHTVKTILIKRIPSKAYHEFTAKEKGFADYLFKDLQLAWLKKLFGTYSPAVGNDIDKLDRLIRDHKVNLPEGLRKEVMDSIKKYRD